MKVDREIAGEDYGPIRVSGVAYKNPVGKQIEFTDDRSGVTKTPLLEERACAGEMINKAFSTPQEAFRFRSNAAPTIMFLSGTFSPDLQGPTTIVPKWRLSDDTARAGGEQTPHFASVTKDFLDFRPGPGFISIDIDAKSRDQVAALWPEAGIPTLKTPREALAALYEVLPEALGCPIMVMPSSGSMIEEAATGRLLKGPGGWRILLVTRDASQTPGVLNTIHERCWARKKYRYAFVSRGGAFLERSLADLALGRPTQPDYPTAVLGDGLKKSENCSLMENLSGEYFDPGAVCLTDEERRAARSEIDKARASLRPAVVKTKSSAMERCTRQGIERGLNPNVAKRIAQRKFEADILLGSEIVQFGRGEQVKVADLLSEAGKDFDGRTCLDPIEPDYDGGREVAIFYWNDGLRPGIHSFAHGSGFFRLMYDMETADAAIDASGKDHGRMAAIIAKADLADIDQSRLERKIAGILGLGNSRWEIRSAIASERSRIAQASSRAKEEAGFTRPDDKGPRMLDTPLVPASFPQKKIVNGNIRVLDHRSNLKHMLDAYGIEYRYNVINKEFEWEHLDLPPGGDHADIGLYSQLVSLAALNGMPKDSLDTHLTALGDTRSYNPVTDHLRSLKWDCQHRIGKLADEMEAGDPRVARIALRLFFLQACAAADNAKIAMSSDPKIAAHFEHVLVFVGDQGLGKTIGARKLLPVALRRYFKEGVDLDLKDKDSRMRAIAAWVVELGELDSTFRKSDIAALKAFLSQSCDEIRMPYARRSSRFGRRTVFVGTVNDVGFLADETGNRRYLPLTVSKVDVGWPDEEIEQVWAEAWARYARGERWWPTEKEEAILSANADRYRARSAIEDKLEAEYEWGAAPDWKGGRNTATAIFKGLDHLHSRDPNMADLKTVGAAMKRLWKGSGLVETRGGELHIRNEAGEWVKVNADSGKARGWLLPPTKVAVAHGRLEKGMSPK